MQILSAMLSVWAIYTIVAMILRVVGQIGRSLSLGILKLTRIGVYFHELCHFVIAKCLGFKVSMDQIVISGSAGSVRIRPHHPEGLTAFQALYLAFAPLAIGTLVLIELWNVTKGYWGNWPIVIGLGIAMFTLLLVLPPSFKDVKNVVSAIYHRPGIALLHVAEGSFVYLLLPEFLLISTPFIGILPPMLHELLVFTLMLGILELGRVGIATFVVFCCQKLGVVTTKSEPFRVKTAPHITLDYLLDPTPAMWDFVGNREEQSPH
jgi:hypothetical protein